jgi:hypothetical protein
VFVPCDAVVHSAPLVVHQNDPDLEDTTPPQTSITAPPFTNTNPTILSDGACNPPSNAVSSLHTKKSYKDIKGI